MPTKKSHAKKSKKNGAQLLVDCLNEEKVKYIFGIPGAVIMPILDVLADGGGPEFILCRHEQNAAFMAQCWGRLTETPGVVLVTDGPGATNIVTGAATATADRDPFVAITGQVPRVHRIKRSHQNIDTKQLFAPITKWSVAISDANGIPEAVSNAFRTALLPHEGATHLSIPIDVLQQQTNSLPIIHPEKIQFNVSHPDTLTRAADILNRSKFPVILLGLGATKKHTTLAVRSFIETFQVPVVGTFEAAGAVSRKLVHTFVGRVGLKTEEPGDIALKQADVIIAIGFDPIEYDPSYWERKRGVRIIHIDEVPASLDQGYQPTLEIVGDVARNIEALCELLHTRELEKSELIQNAREILLNEQKKAASLSGVPIHPARFIHDLRKILGDDATVISDVGSHQMWLARHFFSYEPRTLLFSMGFQTMGVALPWAMATTLARPHTPVVSISGDGSFLMSAMELENAVRHKMHFVHFVWRDGSYNLVEIQQMAAYGRSFATRFGNPDIVAFAKSFGAHGLRISKPDDIIPTLRKALRMDGPIIIDVPVDYRQNIAFFDPKTLFV